MQDPAAGGGVASGSVQYAGSASGVSQINGLSTYTGTTMLDGFSTVKIGSDYNIGGTSGPFGLGTLTANNTSNNNILMPIGGNRTVANPVSMATGGLIFANDVGDTSSLTLSGPISMAASGRFLTNNFGSSGGTLTLGSAASPSTITLPNTAGQTFTIAGTGATVINDVIQNTRRTGHRRDSFVHYQRAGRSKRSEYLHGHHIADGREHELPNRRRLEWFAGPLFYRRSIRYRHGDYE